MELKTINIDEYKPHPQNPHGHPDNQIAALGKSLDDFEQYKNVVVWRGFYLAGHGIVEAARRKGIKTLEAKDMSHLSAEQATALMAADVLLPELATIDNDLLSEVLADFGDPLEVPGVDVDLLKEIEFGDYGAPGAPADTPPMVDRAEELRVKWGVESGQLWRLGDHKLICGDCTERGVVERVMEGRRADTIATDAPYGQGQKGVPNDEPEKHRELVFSSVNNFPIGENCIISCFQSPRLFGDWLDAIRKNGHHFERMLWVYKVAQMTYPWRGWLLKSEAILLSRLGGNPHWNEVSPNSHDCYYLSELSGQLDKNLGWHGSVKDLSIVSDLIARTSYEEDLVYDPFLGSGTTLIACENLNRQCRAIEISPAYVAVTLQRYADHTGQTPRLIED